MFNTCVQRAQSPSKRAQPPIFASQEMTCLNLLSACWASAIETQEDILTDVLLDDEWSLTLFNDNHNTFDHVIECLITTCGHDALQAEQCAMIVHFKGKCTVKTGSYDDLAPMYKQLAERDLTVELNP